MSKLAEIEGLTKDYAEAREHLARLVGNLEAEVETAKARQLPAIKDAVVAARAARERLAVEIQASPDIFQKPKTHIMHNIKVGFQKARGRLTFANIEQTVKLIRRYLPDQASSLIQVKETPISNAVAQLPGVDLRRIGATLEEDTDLVVIRPMDGDVEKMVDALLKDSTKNEAAESAA